jgi:CDP-diacylglycerol--serine O-phosphatidyltransferase
MCPTSSHANHERRALRNRRCAAREESGSRRVLAPERVHHGTLFGGFYAIVAAINGDFSRAGIAVFVAMLFDGLDGRVARWTHTQSDFGKEYDSLCDMVAFGVAPAIVTYQWGIERIADYGKFWGRFGWLARFFYAVAAALRLARFNARAARRRQALLRGSAEPIGRRDSGELRLACERARSWRRTHHRRAGGTGAGVQHHDLHRRADGQSLLVLERQRAERTRADSLGVRAADPAALLMVSLAPASLFALFGTYALSAPLFWLWRKVFKKKRVAESG